MSRQTTEPPCVIQAIVCVDDDLPMLHSLREQLMRELGSSCVIELASGGKEALQLLADLAAEGVEVPLLISDYIMPGMRGTELLARAHRIYPQMLTILLTGQADVDAVGHAVNQANLYRLLTKPWQEGDLTSTVREALRRVDHEQQLVLRTAALAAASDRLEQSLQLLQATMDATLDGLLVLGPNGEPLQINRQLVELWGISETLVLPQDGPALLEHLLGRVCDPETLRLGPFDSPHAPSVLELVDGRALDHVSRAQVMNGKRIGTVYSFRDVTARERSIQLFRHQALHDTLSGLPNRLQFGEALDRAVDQARAANGGLSVLFVDLDHFKRINDTLGHDFGDKLLICAAERLSGCLREGDLIARWGGDEFTVLVPKLRNGDEAAALARRILAALELPFLVGDMPLQISASVGVASYPADGDDGQALLRRADIALYRAKEAGRNGFQCFRHSAHDDIGGASDLALETDLRRAIERRELLLHYQPQLDTRTGLITGVEALARWHHVDRGWVSPRIFIPLTEQAGMIVALGEWVLQTASRQAADWRDQGLGDVHISVNLSAVQFDRSHLVAVVMQALSSTGLVPQALELDVTEALALRHLETTASTLSTLQRSVIQIALDDFGTGCTSLTYLIQLPCDTLKVDRTFIGGLEAGSKDAAIIGALVALANGLNLRIVVEGVETKQVAALLQQLGRWTMQGYLYGRPAGAHEVTTLLRRQWQTCMPASRFASVE